MNHPNRSRRRNQVDFADAPHREPDDRAPGEAPNIAEFDDAAYDIEGLRRIGSWVLIPDYDLIARGDSAEHHDWRARRDAKAAYGAVVYHGSGDVLEGYAAARDVLRAHLRRTGRVVKWQVGAGQYLSP